MSDPGKAVFLSYASQDAEAAKRICDALRAAGVEVWFDQSELVGGDQWDQKIRKQIKDCALLIPIISAATQARTEGYFRLEWRLADQRTHLMAKGRAFLLPVVIDDTRDGDAHVPDSFTEVQWTRLKGGETPVAFAERVRKLLGNEVGPVSDRPFGSPAPSEAGHRPALPRKSPRWIMPAVGGAVVAVIALAIARPWNRPAALPPASGLPPPASTAAPAAALTEAQKLVAQARSVYEGGDALNRENLYFAEDLLKRAQALDPTESTAWEFGAGLSYQMVWFSIENTEKRRELLVQQADRALALAPRSVPARLAVINARLAVNFNRKSAAEGFEREIEDLAAREPGNWRVQSSLSTTYRFLNRPEKSLASMRRALELSDGNPEVAADLINLLWRLHLYPEAEAVAAASLPVHASARLIVFDAFIKLRWKGDVAAAKKSMTAFPAWLLQEDRGLFMAWQIGMWSRDPERAQRAASGAPRDYVRSFAFYGPRAVLTAQAHEMAGHAEAARADWQIVLDRAGRELTDEPDNDAALYWKAWALARLGQMAEARTIAARLQQLGQNFLSAFAKGTYLAPLLVTVGQTDAALAEIKARMGAMDDSLGLTRATLELDPAYDPIRQDPRFQELVARAPAPSPASSLQSPSHLPEADAKSVAVLAFANLSDDKANEYFSDGISEELLNVLAKVPGLKVSARTSAFYFKGKEVPIPEIAKQLGVAYVVEGSVRKQGDKVRITAQLIKAADGFHVWSDTFTRDLKDIFAVQDEIAGLIARNLELKMGIGETGTRQAVSPEAYQEYLLGRAAFAKAGMADLREAVVHFERTLQLEPKYAAAWVQLASTHTRLGRWGGTPTLQAWAAARTAIDRARALEPDSPEMLVALGWILRTGEWDWRGAEQAFRRALALQPNQPDVLAGAAVLLFNVGKTDEAFRLSRQAVQLDPLNPGTQIDLSIMFYLNGNPAEAEQAARRALQLAPGGASYHAILSWSLIAQGRFAEAEAEIALETDVVEGPTARGLLAIARGEGTEAKRMIARLEDLARVQPDAADLQQSIAWIAALLGDKEKAFATLEKALVSRDPSMSWLRNSKYLQSLETDARWPALLRKLGLADNQLK